ncbi:MAG TPA: hypothetical protein VMH85_04045 [Terriglobales bacterium]|nr:hypothetical protein [Terriglobales bacterium]
MFSLAQSAPEVEITAEPSHHLLLQNRYVRAFYVEVPSGAATLVHRHRHDYIYVMLGPAEVTNEAVGKPPARMQLHDGDTGFFPGNFAHRLQESGPTPFRNVTVELMQDELARKSPPRKWDEERGLQILEGGTQDILFVKDGVRASEFDLQPGGMLPAARNAAPRLLIAVSDVDLRSHGAGKIPKVLKPGEVVWLSGGSVPMLMNMGKTQARFITLEFH